MAKKESASQKKIHRVMHEYKHGTLRSSSGPKVKNRKQAIAIALSEAGKSKRSTSRRQRRSRR